MNLQPQPTSSDTPKWIEVIAPGAKAVLIKETTEASEVVVQSYFFTPQGMKYLLQAEKPTIRWTVEAGMLQRIIGVRKIGFYNSNMGEEKPKS